MSIETAKFVVQRAGVQLKCTGADIATKLQEGDLMAVTRPGDDTYKWTVPALPTGITYTIDTRLQPSTNGEFGFAASAFNFTANVDWGDGTIEERFIEYTQITHTYATPGIYSVYITSTTPFYPMASNDYGQGAANGAWSYGPQVLDVVGDPDYKLPGAFALFMRMINLTDVIATATQFDYTDAESCGAMFQRSAALSTAPSLKPLGLKPIYASAMFEGQSSLTTVPIDFMDTSRVASIQQFFEDCTNLQSVPAWDISTLDIKWKCLE